MSPLACLVSAASSLGNRLRSGCSSAVEEQTPTCADVRVYRPQILLWKTTQGDNSMAPEELLKQGLVLLGLWVTSSSLMSINAVGTAVRARISRRQFTLPAPSCHDVTAKDRMSKR